MGDASQTPAAPAPAGEGPDLTGRRLGDFQVLRRLGSGGMGQVFLAEQISLRRHVALKVLRPELTANVTALERFRREAEIVARIHHANIVQVYDFRESDGTQFIALEYVEGRNLRDFVARRGPPEAPLAISIMRQVASALQRASEHGIVHRDIKPENILLTRKGEVKVTDFGLVSPGAVSADQLRLTASGVAMGTPLYMSPEQVQGGPTDARTDIYSLGVTSYHMLAGQPPFSGNNPYDVALKHVTATPAPLQAVRPDLPPELCAVVHKMMEKDPAQRYQTGRDLIKDLQRLRESIGAGHATQAVSLDSLPPLPPIAPRVKPVSTMEALPAPAVVPRPRRDWPWLLPLTAVLALAAGGGVAWALRQAEAAPTSAAPLPGDLSALQRPETLDDRERRLQSNVLQYASPRDPNQVRLGLGLYAELGLFYLDHWRLDDAERVFLQLEKLGQDVKPYGTLGRLGRAIILGLRNQPDASNRVFIETFREPRQPLERFEIWEFLNQTPQLRQWIALALDFNLANSPQTPFSKEQLDVLRPERPTRWLTPPVPRVPPIKP